MHSIITEKVPGGKLVRLKVDFDKVINSVQITGDFFLHPEEAVEKLERCLIGCAAAEPEARFAQKLNAAIAANSITLIGVSAEDLARLTKKATEEQQA